MRIILWPSRDHVPIWRQSIDSKGYKAGELVQWNYREYVCINTHQRSGVLEPPRSSLWAEVKR